MEITGYVLYWFFISVPLGMIGLYYLIEYVLLPRYYNNRGYIKIRKLTPNNRWRTFWVKPEIEKTKEGAYAYFFKHKGEIFPFIDQDGMVTLEGNNVVAHYDVEGNQINLKKMEKIMPQVAPRMLDSMLKRVWNVARASAMLNQKTILMLIIIAIIAAIAATVVGIINIQNTQKLFSELANMIGQLNYTMSTQNPPGVLTPLT